MMMMVERGSFHLVQSTTAKPLRQLITNDKFCFSVENGKNHSISGKFIAVTPETSIYKARFCDRK